MRMAVETRKVLFPAVHEGQQDRFIVISGFLSRELKGTIKVVSGIDEDSARHIIGASRYGESDERAAYGVIVSFESPLFFGDSYGLALAILDKLVRYKPLVEYKTCVATGKLRSDGKGTVSPIGGFESKLKLILSLSNETGCFVYPRENEVNANAKELGLLEQLRTQGNIHCIAVTRVSELDGVLWQVNHPQKEFRPESGGHEVAQSRAVGGGIAKWLMDRTGMVAGASAIAALLVGGMFWFGQDRPEKVSVSHRPMEKIVEIPGAPESQPSAQQTDTEKYEDLEKKHIESIRVNTDSY